MVDPQYGRQISEFERDEARRMRQQRQNPGRSSLGFSTEEITDARARASGSSSSSSGKSPGRRVGQRPDLLEKTRARRGRREWSDPTSESEDDLGGFFRLSDDSD